MYHSAECCDNKSNMSDGLLLPFAAKFKKLFVKMARLEKALQFGEFSIFNHKNPANWYLLQYSTPNAIPKCASSLTSFP